METWDKLEENEISMILTPFQHLLGTSFNETTCKPTQCMRINNYFVIVI